MGRVAITAMIGVNSSAMSRGLKRAGMKMRAWAKASMARLAAITKAGMLLAGAAFAIFAVKGVKAFAQLEKGMNEVFTLLPGISKSAMGKMEEQVLQLSQKMGVIPEEVVPALYQALSAGVAPENVFKFLETSVKASKAGVVDLGTAVDALTTVVNTYGKENITAARAGDIMFEAVKMGKTTFGEMAATMYNVLPIAKSAGVGFADIAAAVATMTAKGTPTAQVFTQLKAAILSIMAPTKRTAGLFQNYGLDVRELGETMKGPGGLVEAMNQIVIATNGDAQALRRLLGSSEALNAVLTLTGDKGKQFAGILNGIASESGQMDTAFAQMDKGLARSWEKISANAKVAMIKFGKALAPLIEKVTPAIQKVIAAIGGIDWAGIINGFARVWVIGIKPLFDELKTVLSNLPWGNLLTTLLPIATVLIKTIQNIIKIAIGLAPALVPGIGVVGNLFILIYGKFFLLVALMSKLAPGLGKIWKSVFEILRTAFLFFLYPTRKNFEAFMTFTKTKLKEIWKNFKSLGGDLKKIATTVFNEIKKIVVPIVVALFGDLIREGEKWLNQFPGFKDAIEGWGEAWVAVKDSLLSAWETLKPAFALFAKEMASGTDSAGPLKEMLSELAVSLVKLFLEFVNLGAALGRFVGTLIECVALLFGFSLNGDTAGKKMSALGSVVWFLMKGLKVLVDVLAMIFNGWAKIFEQLNKLKPVLKVLAVLFGLLIKGVQIVVGKIIEHFKNIHKFFVKHLGEIAELFVEAWDAIANSTGDFWDRIKKIFNALKKLVFKILFGGTVTKDFKKAFDYISKVVMKVLDKIQDVFKTVFDGVKMGLDGLQKVFKTFGDFVNSIFDKILSVGGKAMDLAKGVLKAAGGVFGGILGKLGGGGGSKAAPKGPRVGSGASGLDGATITTSLKPIVEKLTSMDGSLKSIDKTLQGKFVNQ
tara:strand:+ start:10967 stop:13762 length:2796 start_codon:yes stop_codon:yes gene_type:complete